MKSSGNKSENQRGNPLYTFFVYFGNYITNVLYVFLFNIWNGIRAFFKALWSATGRLRKRISRRLVDFGIWALTPVVKRFRQLRAMGKEVKEAKNHKGIFAALGKSLKQIAHMMFAEKGIVSIIFNYAAPVICIVFLFNIVTYANSIDYAVKLSVNGRFLGYIENEQVFNDAKKVVQDRVDYIGGIEVEAVPEYSVEPLGYSETLNQYQVADLILQNSGINLTYGYGFYINDEFYGALEDYSKVEEALNRLLDNYKTNNPTEEVAFVDNISYNQPGQFLSDSMIDEDWLIQLITGTKNVAKYYEVELGDSHSLIGDKVDMTQAELEELNPGFSDQDLRVGDMIKTKAEEPFLSVGISKVEEYDVEVPFETKYEDDNNIYVGSSRPRNEGENGINHVTARVTYINDVETSRDIIKIETTLEPVDQIIAVGTKPTPAGTFSDASAAFGKFIWPVDGGEISQTTAWDGGYSGHSGVDISGIGYGSPVYAGAAGTVTYAGWSNGYGNYVIIYHPELGLSTLYGHNSALYVSVGETVAQGQCIAGAGATGWAQGIHVHFEVRVNNSPVNPLAYMDIPDWVRIYNY